MIIDIKITPYNKLSCLIQKQESGLFSFKQSRFYSIIIFNEKCDYLLNFKANKSTKNSVLFLSSSDTFYLNKKNSGVLIYSLDGDFFDKKDNNTQTLLDGLLFNNLLNTSPLTLTSEEIETLKKTLNEALIFQAELNYRNLENTLKKIIQKTILIKHFYSFSDSSISKEHKVAYTFLSLILEKFKIEHNVSFYAQSIGIQPKVLTKLFNDLNIETPKKYLNKKIVFEAKKQLTAGSKKTVDISYDIGFNDPAYFSRFFKKNTGITTRQYKDDYTQIIKKEKSPII